MSDEEKHGTSAVAEVQPKVVPLEKYEKDKAGLLEDVVRHRKRAAEAEQKVKELETRLQQVNYEDLTEAEQQLFKRNKDLIDKEAQLGKRETLASEKERKHRARELAAEYGVDEAELLTLETVEEMEKVALQKGYEKLMEQTKTKEPEKPKRSKFESETPSLKSKSVRDMNAEEFAALRKQVRAGKRTL